MVSTSYGLRIGRVVEWEDTAGTVAFQLFPGELRYQGSGTAGGNGIKSPIVTPGGFYAEPERYGAYFQRGEVVSRASIALYDYWKKDGPVNIPGLAVEESLAVLQTPRSWRNSYVYNESIVNLSRRGQVSWTELETPNNPVRGQVSWVEFETPDSPRRGQLSWIEFEVPNNPVRCQVSWVEFEAPNTMDRAKLSWIEFEVPEASAGRWIRLGRRFRFKS